MKYAIIVDSGCDMRRDDFSYDSEHILFHRVPLELRIGDKVFTDDFSLNVEDFMHEMEACNEAAGSAAPSPQAWQDAYLLVDEVFAITITGGLSGSYASAVSARDMLSESMPEKKVHIIDSLSTGPEIGLLVEKLVSLMEQNLTFEQIVTEITAYQKKTHLLFILENLDNLVKGGRVSPLVGKVAGILGIRILGKASEEGTLALLDKCRGKTAVYDKLISEMMSHYRGGNIIISHCFQESKAKMLADKIREAYPKAKIKIMRTSGLDSFYAQRGGLLVGYEA
ncbi:MAG: DegV family protein [Lachnospiraceae bacterium]|nr:DegV family protein [Lachnospiraceae bacterium]